jgi:xanthine/uracil/vitamin C permease (AzgA family)
MIPDKDLEHLIEIRVRRVNALAFSLGAGLVMGVGLFLATNLLVLKGGPIVGSDEGPEELVGPHLGLLGQFFPGYQVTFLGSLIGFAYSFVLGAVVFYAGAWLYNWVADYRYRRRR